MKLLSAQQIKQWDACTIQQEPIASIDLMERAAIACAKWFMAPGLLNKPIKILCGTGNNGGDGLAIARLLMEKGIMPAVHIIGTESKGSDDFQINQKKLQSLSEIHFINSQKEFPAIDKNDLVIDCLFGSGLNRPLNGINKEIIEHINASKATVISIDVPSGMFIDKSSKGNSIVKADHVLTFQSLKLCFLVAENAAYFGKVEVLDIELDKNFPDSVDTIFQLVDEEQVSSYIKPRNEFSHKGTYGHALLIAGNKGKMGAAVLAARACLRTGVGLLTVDIPTEQSAIIQETVPESMVAMREEALPELDKFSAIGIGPGLGTDDASQKIVFNILEQCKHPLLLDADALTILSKHPDWLKNIPSGSILTPHPKEFERVFGVCENDFERLEKAIELSKQYPFIIVLKGHYTLIAFKGKGYFNTTGNAGMAKGGSGDTLTGIITSLLAQGYGSLESAITGVWLHGSAADIALDAQSMESLLPSDLIEYIGKAFDRLRK